MKIVLTGGGTAGHVLPAINVGLYLRKHFEAELHFVGNENFIEKALAEQHSIPFHAIPSRGLEGKNVFDKYINFGLTNAKGVVSATKILKKLNPDYVLATGGFVSAPVLASAKLLKIPFSIHEQNSVLGKVNKLFQSHAQTVFHSFPVLEKESICYSGNPVQFKQKLKENGEKVLFIGGSGGSIKINESAISFAKNNPNIPSVLITGKKLYEKTLEKTKGIHLPNLKVIDYAEDMLEVYKQAKIIVCRSGAGTIFEIANLSIPSIFVPLPTSADDHQKKNAQYFMQEGAGVIVEQSKNFHENLEKKILELWNDKQKRDKIKKRLDLLAVRDSDKVITEKILKNLGEHPFYFQK